MPLLDPGERRHWRGYLEPAAVIMAGVLAVVVFGVVLYQRATGDDPNPPGPAAVATIGPADKIPIPLPSITPSMAPIDSIVYERVPISDTVDLSAEGAVDWVHWGEQGRYSLERDADGGFLILEDTPAGPRERHTRSPEKFRWTGGAPLAKTSGVSSGIGTCGEGNGFTLSAPAGPQRSTLTLYVGATSARGSLQVGLSTSSTEKITDSWVVEGDAMKTTAYVISYRASGTGKISVKWITAASFGTPCGGVTLQAATLS